MLQGVMLCLSKPSGGSGGQCQLQHVAPLPNTPVFSFCPETACLPSIDGCLLMSVASNILWSSVVQKPLNSHEWMALCFKKNPAVVLIVIRLCGHFEKLSKQTSLIHMTGYRFPTANVESCILRSHAMALAEQMSVSKSFFELEDDYRRSSIDDLIVSRIILHPLLHANEAVMSTRSAKSEHMTVENESRSCISSVWDQKLLCKQNRKYQGQTC